MSGFALENDDDTNTYQDDKDGHGASIGGYYTTKIHSPAVSEDEGNNVNGDHRGLFGESRRSGITKRGRLRGRRNGVGMHRKTGPGDHRRI